MDVLRKMFKKSQDGNSASESEIQKDEFRKPAWYEEDETDDELFGKTTKAFQIFTNPIEVQKHFERQMNEMMKTIRELEDNGELFDRNLKDEYLKPGFENEFLKTFNKEEADTDLDGEIHPDELHSLVQRVVPELSKLLPRRNNVSMETNKIEYDQWRKLSDIEKVLCKMHGSYIDEDEQVKLKRSSIPPMRKRSPTHSPRFSPHFGGVFEGSYQGPKMFGQSVVTHTILKPDGTYETKRTVKDSEGNIKTTITRTKEGKTETITTYGDGKTAIEKGPDPSIKQFQSGEDENGFILPSDRNIFLSKKGYALPLNLW